VLSNLKAWMRRLICRWTMLRESPPKMDPLVFQEALLSQRTDIFWQALEQYIDTAADPERLLKVKRELGMKGYHYMVGYIKGQRDIARFVKRVREVGRGAQPARPSPIRTGGIAKYVQ